MRIHRRRIEADAGEARAADAPATTSAAPIAIPAKQLDISRLRSMAQNQRGGFEGP
jgi:hypothetical protein